MTFPTAKEERLHSAAPITDYKTLRLQEWASILDTEFPDLVQYKDTLLAHLSHECGAMSEDCGWTPGSPRSDHGLAIGIAQWHVCYRYADWLVERKLAVVSPGEGCKYLRPTVEIREKFFEDHEDMRTHFGQFRKYAGDMQHCLAGNNRFKKKDDIGICVRLWNWNAGMPYLNAVKDKKPKILALLSQE